MCDVGEYPNTTRPSTKNVADLPVNTSAGPEAPVGNGVYWQRLFAGRAVDAFAEQVGVAVVAGVLLDHVGENPAQ